MSGTGLKRYWFTFERSRTPAAKSLGCGITAHDREDALRLLQDQLGKQVPLIKAVIEDVDVSTLDSGHVLPNIGDVTVRGIWFPQMPVWSGRADKILSVGLWLGGMGIHNWVLTRAQTLAALDALPSAGLAVLGVEVFRTVDGEIEKGTEGCHCDQQKGEPFDVFVQRSADALRQYVASFLPSDENVLFDLVLG